MTTITGTAGDDTLTGTSGDDVISGLGGDDLITGLDGNDVLSGGAGMNRLDGGGGFNTADYSQATTGVTVSLATTAYQNTGYSNDQLVSIQSIIGSAGFANHLIGGEGDDTLNTGKAPAPSSGTSYSFANVGDMLDGGDGNDTLIANGNSNGDVLTGGAGNDTITAGFSGTVLLASIELFTAIDGAPVTLNGGDGNDTITALSHAIINGGAGDDIITVGTGAVNTVDLHRTGYDAPAGTDATVQISGGTGNDTFVIANPIGTAVISDFSIVDDKIDLSNSVSESLNGFSAVKIGQQGADTVYFSGDNFDTIFARLSNVNAASIPTSDYLNLNEGPSPENPNNAVLDPAIIYTYGTAAAETITANDAYGAAGDDVLQGTSTGSYLYGGAGNDVITAVAGGATLSGGDGNDILHAVVGGNTIDGGTGDDILDYSGSTSAISFNLSSNPVVTGTGGTDLVQNVQTIIGTAYADTMGAAAAGSTLMGGAGADTLIGGAGNDVLVGGKDADTLTGGAGADTFLFNSGESIAGGADTITDFQTGADKVDLSGVDPTTISLVRLGSGTVIFAVDPNGPQTVIYVNGVINGGDVLVNGVDPSVTLVAQDSGGVLIGGTGADRLVGGAGNDVLTGGLGADLLTGGAGADTFKYLTIDDSTHDARDIITDFQTGVDTLDLTAVAPTVVTLERYQGATYLFAQDGFGHQLELATLTDLNAGDIVTGGSAPGVTLIGDVGGDTLVGGSGADVIVGGGGADALYGGAGADTFKYLAPSDSTPQAYDIIHDFVTGADKVDLTALDPVNVSILHYNGGTFINGVGTNNAVFQIASIHDINAPDIIGLTSGAYIVGDTLGDTLIGGSFAETIAGGSGNDVIIGGGGADALYGGGGTNVFRYLAASDSTTSAPDIIHDFVTGVDKIDLTAVHAGSSSASYGLAFTATGSYLFVDTNGDGMNDMLIEVASPNLHAADILW